MGGRARPTPGINPYLYSTKTTNMKYIFTHDVINDCDITIKSSNLADAVTVLNKVVSNPDVWSFHDVFKEMQDAPEENNEEKILFGQNGITPYNLPQE